MDEHGNDITFIVSNQYLCAHRTHLLTASIQSFFNYLSIFRKSFVRAFTVFSASFFTVPVIQPLRHNISLPVQELHTIVCLPFWPSIHVCISDEVIIVLIEEQCKKRHAIWCGSFAQTPTILTTPPLNTPANPKRTRWMTNATALPTKNFWSTQPTTISPIILFHWCRRIQGGVWPSGLEWNNPDGRSKKDKSVRQLLYLRYQKEDPGRHASPFGFWSLIYMHFLSSLQQKSHCLGVEFHPHPENKQAGISQSIPLQKTPAYFLIQLITFWKLLNKGSTLNVLNSC